MSDYTNTGVPAAKSRGTAKHEETALREDMSMRIWSLEGVTRVQFSQGGSVNTSLKQEKTVSSG